ncbi:hypothetical protein MTP03_00510 [Tsukamurella sp. PLM1]|nr:hypothetical protein MTP03_00510 [Tsukamurella sp. PLM1]
MVGGDRPDRAVTEYARYRNAVGRAEVADRVPAYGHRTSLPPIALALGGRSAAGRYSAAWFLVP